MAVSSIHETAIIYPNVKIGKGVVIGAYCIIGAPPEHKDFFDLKHKSVIIKDNAIITGHCTIDSGTESDTVISENCFIMKAVHVGHDSIISEGVTIAPHAIIGGHVEIGKGANIGMGAMIHQRVKIGRYSMLGMGTIVTKKTPIWPYGKFIGSPARHLDVNISGKHLSKYQYWKIKDEWKNSCG